MLIQCDEDVENKLKERGHWTLYTTPVSISVDERIEHIPECQF